MTTHLKDLDIIGKFAADLYRDPSHRAFHCGSPCRTARGIRSSSRRRCTPTLRSRTSATSRCPGSRALPTSTRPTRHGASCRPRSSSLITAETGSVYLDTPGQCVIEDRGWRRRVVVEKNGAASTVNWNPWAEKAAAIADLGDAVWRGMGCVEAGNIADNEVLLAQNGEHQMSTTIFVDTKA